MALDNDVIQDQTTAGCDAIAQAVLNTGAAVQSFQKSAIELQAKAKDTLAKASDKFKNLGQADHPEDMISAAVQTEIQMLQTMAESVERAQTTASESMAAALEAVGATAGSEALPANGMAQVEQATLQAIQAMSSN